MKKTETTEKNVKKTTKSMRIKSGVKAGGGMAGDVEAAWSLKESDKNA